MFFFGKYGPSFRDIILARESKAADFCYLIEERIYGHSWKNKMSGGKFIIKPMVHRKQK